MAAIPTELIDELALIGPKEHMRDQLENRKTLEIDFTMLVGLDAQNSVLQLAVIRDLSAML